MAGFYTTSDRARMPAATLKSDAGFSLIEALVALTIFSIAAIALLSVQKESTHAQLILEDKFIAEIVAENILIEQQLSSSPARGQTLTGLQENGGKKWRWALSRSPLKDSTFINIQVEITDNATGQIVYIANTLESAAQ